MKLRTQAEVLDAMDRELAWRKKEVNNTLAATRDARHAFQAAMARASFALVYSHWEGGVKNCASYFLEYVSRQKHVNAELRTNFLAISCASSIKHAAASGRMHLYGQVVDFLCLNQAERYQMPSSFEIDTESNLSSKVFENICFTIGVSLGEQYQTSRQFIDRELVKVRNEIAHGEQTPVAISHLIDAKDRVMLLLDLFRTELQNAVVQKRYLR